MSESMDKKANLGCLAIILGIVGIIFLIRYISPKKPQKFKLVSEKNMAYSLVLIYQAKENVNKEEAIKHARNIPKGESTSITMIYFNHNAKIPEELKEDFIMDSYYFKNCMGIAHKPAQDSLQWNATPVNLKDLLHLQQNSKDSNK